MSRLLRILAALVPFAQGNAQIANTVLAPVSAAVEPGASPQGPRTMKASAPAEESALEIDATKKFKVQAGEEAFAFPVHIKNVSAGDVTILQVRTTCGCTVALLPSQPWTLHAGETGTFQLQVDLRGKSGTLVKAAFVDTARGYKQLSFIIELPENAESAAERRLRGMQLSTADRQAVFKGDCATCHASPTMGLKGEALYAAACGICHEAEHRATMVPDLRALTTSTNSDFWRTMIVAGKPGTLMPGFSADMGGPLSKPQIDSLVEYLVKTFTPLHPAAAKEGKATDAAK